ncbi:MAG: TIGR03086 family metal-binding protein [Nitriliruptorales bacterium]|nr:TIGR03086 family metal-binding protein [Nitriliruptorales bacterium]
MDTDVTELHRRALLQTREVVAAIPDDRWSAPTPCSEWDVRDVVGHLTTECLWVPEILAGKTIEEVGDRFEGDMLGDQPRQAFDAAADGALAAMADLDDLQRTVHLSFGDVPAEVYAWQLFTDALVHGWDAGRGAGLDVGLDPDLCEAALAANRPMVTDEVREAGIIGPEVEVADDAPVCDQLLGFLGRDPAWSQ